MVLIENMDPAEIQVEFDPNQEVAFFTQATQMGFGERTHRFLRTEGFGTVASLYEMDDDILDTLVSNARKPAGTMSVGAANAEGREPTRIPVPPFSMNAKSVSRFKVAHRAVKYYALIQRSVLPWLK